MTPAKFYDKNENNFQNQMKFIHPCSPLDLRRVMATTIGANFEKSSTIVRPIWQEVASRFSDPQECLASFLALEAAEVIEGAKPANLVSVANRRRPCGSNPYELWRHWGGAVLDGSGLAALELADRRDSVLLLLYSPSAMERLLQRANVSAVLKRVGYAEVEDTESVLDQLAARMGDAGFPHEIGVFLGYPLKDVAAFMGWVSIPFACQGPWKIYGDPRESLRLAETFRCCRKRMAERLNCCVSPFECLGGVAALANAFA